MKEIMVLRTIDNHLCCVECDQVFDAKWHLNDGSQCPNVSCPSHVDSALGDVLCQIKTLNEQGGKTASLARALSDLLPIRADSIDAQDTEVLNSLRRFQNVVERTISTVEARTSVAVVNSKLVAFPLVQSNTIPTLKMMGHELDGVIIDVEQGDGFDEECLQTIKRVRDALYGLPDLLAQSRTN